MILTFNNGYPDYIGYRQAFLGNGAGPASYVTGGDPTTLQNNRRFIDVLFGGVRSLSGNYIVYGQPSTIGERSTWNTVWYNAKTGLTTGTVGEEVTAGSNLSGETVVMGGYCGQW